MEDLKKQRKYLRTQATKLLGKEKIMDSEDVVKLEVFKEQLLDKKTELKDIDKNMLTMLKGTDEEIEKELELSEDYQEKLIEAIKKVEITLKERKEQKEKSEVKSKEISKTNDEIKKPTFSARLPKIELPTFDGDLNKWFSFWQIFDANINKREDLSVIEKLSYLLSLLRGEPSKVVSGFAATAENYADVIELLHRQYGHKGRIIDLNVKKILDMKPVASGAQISELRSLITELTINLRNLKNLGIETNNCSPILNTKIKQIIPNELLLLYERQRENEAEESIEALVNFLQKEIQYRQNSTPVLDPKAPIFRPRSQTTSWRSPNRLAPTFQPRTRMQQPRMETPTMPPTMRKSHIICYQCGLAGHFAKDHRTK